MGTPAARRITFGTSATARIEAATTDMRVTREDGSIMGNYDSDKVVLDTTINKRFGGKGTVTIAADQGIEGWASSDTATEEIDGIVDKWNLMDTHWDKVYEIASSDHTIRDDSVNCNFLYVKNLGGTHDARVILDADAEPDILIPPGGSVSLRLNSVSSTLIKVDCAHSDGTTIEYVLAKE
jgi:hypothetical protein